MSRPLKAIQVLPSGGARTQQDFLDACSGWPPDAPLSVWLRFSDRAQLEDVELANYQLMPVGPAPEVEDYQRPLALVRADSGSIAPGLPLKRPLWLLGIEAQKVRPKPRVTLIVRRDIGPEVAAPGGVVAKQPAVKASERVILLPENELPSGPGHRRGRLGGYAWVLVEVVGQLPLLYVDWLGERKADWVELYARLALGEE